LNRKGQVTLRKPVQAQPILRVSQRVNYEEKLRALHQHALLLSSASNMDEILDRTLNAMEYALGFDVADFYLAEGGSLNVKRTKGVPMGLSTVNANGRSLVAKAARSQKTVRVSDTRKEADYVDRKGWDWNGSPTMLSELAVPIVIDGKTAGVLNVENAQLGGFTDNDQMLLETLAAHVMFEIQRLEHVQELRRSSQFLETIIENASVWVNVLDNENNIVIWNKAAELISGYSREEVLGHKKIWSWLLPDNEYRKQVADSVSEAVQQGRAEQDVEAKIRRKDGETRIISWSERNLLDEHGKVIGSVSIGRDITKRKQVEEALRQSEQGLRRVTDNMLDMVVETDLQGVCKYASPSCKHIMGYDPRDLMGRCLFDFVHPEDLAVLTEMVRRARSTGRLWTGGRFECRFRHAAGHYVWLENMANFVYDEKGEMVGSVIGSRDATERKRVEETLANERNILRQLIDNLPDNIFVKDAQSRFLMSNQAHARLLRAKSPKEIVGKTDFDIFPRELAASYYDDEQAVMQSGQPLVNREERTIDPEGKTRWLLTTKVPLRDDHGNIIGLAGINRDVTERKRMQEELERYSKHLEELVQERTRSLSQSETRYRTLVENIPQKIFSKDRNSVYVSCNDRYAQDLNIRPEEIAGKTDYDFHPRELADHYRAVDKRVIESGETNELEEKYVVNGQEFFVDTIKTPILDSDGNVTGLLGIFWDITQRKKMENALRESESRYRRLFESSPVSLWEEDFSEVKNYFDDLRSRGVKDLRRYFSECPEELDKCASMVKILDVNETTLSLYGAKSVEELRGELRRVFTHDFQDKFREELVALSEGETRFASEFDNQTLAGDIKHVDLILSVIPGYEDTLARVLVSTIDFTERKKMEQRLQQAERLAAVGETAAMVGHDLRNPLQGIAGAAYNMRRYLGNGSDPMLKEMLAVIDNGVDYANKIISDLLEFSRDMQLQRLPTTPKAVVTQAVKDAQIPENVLVEDTTVNSPRILLDEPKIRRVLSNLIRNAVDAMPDGGKLLVSSAGSQKELSISVKDTGVGIAQDELKRIWTPLHTTKAKGIGLGLSICKRIVEAHGGSISVESVVGKGTTFTLKLPIEHAQGGE